MSPIELVDAALELGVNLVQICVRPSVVDLPPEELRQLKRYSDQVDVRLEIGTEGCDADELRRWLDVSLALGSPLIRTIFTQPTTALRDERKQLERIAPELESHGVVLAIENHESASVYELRALLDDLGTSAVGACLDAVNSLGRGEGVREVTRELLPHLAAVHVKDFTTVRGASNMGFHVQGTALGEGRLDTAWMLEQAYDRDPDINVVLEQWTEFQESMERSMALQREWASSAIPRLKQLVDAVSRR
jgi:sugar phosphate isomerase/epimerase